jgi:hypothetical protein
MRSIFSATFLYIGLLWSISSLAHHSFSLEFDVSRPVDLSGDITSIEWTNPHAWVFIDVEDENGNLQNWSVEFLGVLTLMRRGMTPDTVKPGDRVRIVGFGSRDGTNTANATSLTMSDSGQVMWSSEGR